MAKNKLTCFVSCYNESGTIIRVLDCINQQQCDFDYDVVIYDDGSTDGSQELIKSYCRDNKNYSYVFRENNQGLLNNLNDALMNSKSEYFIRNDGDDFSLPNRFKKLVDFMDSSDHVAVLGSGFYHFNYSENIYRKILPATNPFLCKLLLSYMSPVNVGAAIWRVNVLKEQNGFAHTQNKVEGYTTLSKIGRNWEIRNITDALYVYNYGIKTNHRSADSGFKKRDDAMVKVLKANGNYVGAVLWHYRNLLLKIFGAKISQKLTFRKYILVSRPERDQVLNYTKSNEY